LAAIKGSTPGVSITVIEWPSVKPVRLTQGGAMSNPLPMLFAGVAAGHCAAHDAPGFIPADPRNFTGALDRTALQDQMR